MIDTRHGAVSVRRVDDRAAPGRPLVVLHGGGPGCHSASDFRLTLPLLPERPTYLVDLPGYGASPLPTTPISGRFGTYADTLLGVVDALDLAQCDFLTQSLGGIVALVFAARWPERTGRLVTIGSQPLSSIEGIGGDPQLAATARSRYYGTETPRPEALVREIISLEWSDVSKVPAELVAERYAASITPTALAIATNPGFIGEAEDLQWVPEKVQAPTLVVQGSDDPFAPAAYAEKLAQLLPDARSAIVPGTAHHPQSEKPAHTAQLIGAHLLV
jgi:pimeloyl-ACP methyl ester carboxylesterase